ncbi:hypothetical protein PsorP6_013657 [Peronosclerospora sorghi]|uniref:Uncharacterized protein n=1 Tax=Peronosclerospora sorghi TaxID=230839 RepID=A0ACC0VJ72_9STRA|nr:hypothetical protein PsorP6_013657 [Peronosclerospora sorghi]
MSPATLPPRQTTLFLQDAVEDPVASQRSSLHSHPNGGSLLRNLVSNKLTMEVKASSPSGCRHCRWDKQLSRRKATANVRV